MQKIICNKHIVEKYVAQRMSHFFPNKIFAQKGARFWETRLAIPDILYKKNNKENIIFDTKWKKLTNKTDISSGDIFQQYVYCKLFSAKKAFLIYPWYANL
ncbi:MAG: McrC family protein, partial [Treponema sp.]|nr:McrC family protein [Treponema sp.]